MANCYSLLKEIPVSRRNSLIQLGEKEGRGKGMGCMVHGNIFKQSLKMLSLSKQGKEKERYEDGLSQGNFAMGKE